MEEFTSTDLESCINSTPSRSLEDDLKESAISRYHRSITKIQIEEQKKLSETAQLICDEANKLLKKNPNKEDELVKRAQWTLDEERKLSTQRIDDAITAQKEKLDVILSQIETYVGTGVHA